MKPLKTNNLKSPKKKKKSKTSCLKEEAKMDDWTNNFISNFINFKILLRSIDEKGKKKATEVEEDNH